ncbi:sulfotransferase family 2 domain-containing protein [Primorskyibacter aestuariivivens]|uniref:sulfotransferase family 2 domain-containing protein n=1 Tax=Primorskyibacter aestuariivivens TaxID=1888912 RepID=UPI00230080F2|nr:sulfotransferase family 2 domain-containing protein [Primorskyibacter aestuariivivens]MDA7429585.1 sulfotransferase family 2 domain-containing protein [Primorskyibacter aestuariivivens]
MTVILHQHRLFYAAVPKVACTSLKHMFFEAENGFAFQDYQANGQDKHIHNAAYPTMLRTEYPENQIADFLRVAVIRNPIRRLLSAYGNRVVLHRELSEEKAGPALQRLGLSPDPDLDSFVDNLEAYAEAHASIHHHIRPMVDFLGSDPGYFHHFYRLDAMPRFMEKINTHMGTNFKLARMQTGGPKLLPNVLSEERIARLHAFYHQDFDAFGEYFG